jgi:radical SAM protein with 4Fe4S-binding SPASM domain
MQPIITHHLDEVLNHLYINPLEKCNLRCEICYTKKTSPILSEETILAFVKKYKQTHPLQSVTFCGGEVFTLPFFPHLVNTLTTQGLFIPIVTNGTIDRLDEFSHPNLVNLIVSIDGLAQYHDKNRGKGNFSKSMAFLKKGISLGFHVEVFSIVTKQNINHIDELEAYLKQYLGQRISVTYHPRKPLSYLTHHPQSNIVGNVTDFDFLEPYEMVSLSQKRKTFPPKNLGCYQIAVASDGNVYGCCEGISPIGTIQDEVTTLISNLYNRLQQWEKLNKRRECLGCSSPDFVCGMKYES